MFGLHEEDAGLVRRILTDIRKSANCEIGIAGSLAQRALSPLLAERLGGERLHDIDLLLLGTTQESPMKTSLHEDFHVYESHHDKGIWYFGLTHRATGMWVDLFTPAYPQEMAEVVLDGVRYRTTTIESQILYLAQDILWRADPHANTKEMAAQAPHAHASTGHRPGNDHSGFRCSW